MNTQDNLQDLRKLLKKIFIKWYIIAIAVTAAIIIAFVVNRYTVPVYVVSSSIFVSEPKDANNSVAELLYGDELFRNSANLTNDIILLKSYSHVNSTLEGLPYFHVYYYAEGNVLTKELYKSSPIVVAIDSASEDNKFEEMLITCKIVSKETFQLETEDKTSPFKGDKVFDFNKWYDIEGFKFKIHYRNHNRFDEVKFKINNRQRQTNRYIGKLNINPLERESSILKLSMEGETPQRDIDFLNSLVSNYIKNGLEEKNLNAVKTIEFINEQLDQISDSLNNIELRLENFKRSNSGINLSNENTDLFNNLRSLDIEKSNLTVRQNYFEYLQDYIKGGEFSAGVIVPSVYGINDQILNELVLEFIKLQQEVKLIESNVGENHPLINSKKEKRKELSDNIIELIKNLEAANQLGIRDIQRRINELEKALKTLPGLERKYINIQRMYNLSESLYLFLMEKRAEAGIAKSANTPDVKLVDAAMEEGPPIKPQPLKNYLVAIFVGLVVPVLLILLMDYFNDKILYREDLNEITTIPFLGLIGHESKDINMVVVKKPKSGVAESFRTIRSNIHFLTVDDEKKVFVLTSSISGEGKTFCSLNLAGVFSLSGKKTLLIGADLRKPKMYVDFEVNQDMGLTNYLSNAATIEEIIQPTSADSLDIITSGPIPPNPSELLMSERMKGLIEKLKKSYDYIIVDSPPVGLVTDALILMNYADHGIYIVRQNYTPRPLIENMQEMYASGKLKNVSILFNDVKVTKYGYSYGYSYGYGYGYYTDDKKPNFISRLLKR